MSVMRWEPFSDMVLLREAMDRLFEESVVRPRAGGSAAGSLVVPLEVYQTENDVIVKAPLPGVRPEDIDINVLGETLTIKGEIKEDRPEQAGYLLRELRYGPFARTLTLPVAVSADKAEATFQNGVLVLRLPKAESARPRQIRLGSQAQK